MPTDRGPVLELRGLHKHYRHYWTLRRIPVLRGLHLEVRRGEIFGLLGPNGAGKTTTFRCVLGLSRPSAGQVRFEGGALDRLARSRIGFLPEQPYFYEHLTVVETLRFYGRLYGFSGRRLGDAVGRAVEALDLRGREHSPLRILSKGTLQRVGVAQAILHQPSLVILDEPMSGLDPIGRRRMREVILGLREQGATVVFSSHILPDVEALCDRVAILVAGAIREVVDRRDLAPEGYTLTVAGLPAAAMERLTALAADSQPVPGDGAWTLHLPDLASAQKAIDAVRGAGGEVRALAPYHRSLEDRFIGDLGPGHSD